MALTPLGAKFRQRRVGLLERHGHEIVGVVDERDIHPVHPEPVQALLQAAPHSRPGQELADPPHGEPGPVMRRGVEGPDARGPRGLQRLCRRLIADWRVQPANRRAANYQGGGDERAEVCGRRIRRQVVVALLTAVRRLEIIK
jgi:hypothetical protein